MINKDRDAKGRFADLRTSCRLPAPPGRVILKIGETIVISFWFDGMGSCEIFSNNTFCEVWMATKLGQAAAAPPTRSHVPPRKDTVPASRSRHVATCAPRPRGRRVRGWGPARLQSSLMIAISRQEWTWMDGGHASLCAVLWRRVAALHNPAQQMWESLYWEVWSSAVIWR